MKVLSPTSAPVVESNFHVYQKPTTNLCDSKIPNDSYEQATVSLFKNLELRINTRESDGLLEEEFAQLQKKPLLEKAMRAGERERDDKNNVVYMNKEQRSSYRLRADNGQLYRKDGINLLDSIAAFGEHSLLYVISPKGKIYAARGAHHVIHHSSFLAGDNVISAGKIRTSNGKIIRISNNSGHYRPTAVHLLQAIKYFHELGVLSPHALIDIRYNGVFKLKDGIAMLNHMISSEAAAT